MRSFYPNFSTGLVLLKAFRFFLLTGGALLLLNMSAFSQAPVISTFEPQKASYGTIVSLSGTGFAATNEIKVAFGSVPAEVVESSASSIKVKVPAGANYGPISVTNLSSGLTAFSSQPFLLSFGGLENGSVQFAPSVSFSGAGVFDVCTCDLDGDGKNDMVGSNGNATMVTVYLNSSTIGNLNLPVRKDLNLGIRSLFISCGDLDGDGKPELVYTGTATDGSKVVILKNTSLPGSISFAAPQVLSVPQKTFAKPAIQDLDLDGKAEIVLTEQSTTDLIVFKNTSQAGTISFSATPLSFSLPSTPNQGLRIKDVNKDGLADITVSNLYGTNVFFLINKSSAGSISFQAPIAFSASGLSNHELEDLDGDGKEDLITLDYFNKVANIYLNNSTGTTLSFAAAQSFTTGSGPFGLQLGDLNGDQKVDILIGHNLEATAYLFINTSSEGNLSFEKLILPGSGKISNVQVSDMDGDARPDVITADKVNGIFYIFKNQTCIFPEIKPSGPVELCEGASITLTTVQSPLAEIANSPLSYDWMKDGATVGSGYSFEVSSPGLYTVRISSTDGCSATSEDVSVSPFGTSSGDLVFNEVDNACESQPLTLSVSPALEGASYTWTNAAGFQENSNSNSITIPAADPALHAGVYTVTILKSGCEFNLQSDEISISPIIIPTISADGSLSLCHGESRTLSTEADFEAYQWKKDGTAITGATSATYSASEAGSYTVVAKSTSGCEGESAATKIEVAAPLTAAFDAPTPACVNQPIKFTDKSTLAAGKAASYLWDFGDGTQSTEASPTHTYSQANNSPYTVSLRVQYQNAFCSSTYSRPIYVQNIEGISMQALGATDFCSGDSVKIEVNGEVAEVQWSNGDRGPFTYAKESGILEAEILSASGCTLKKSITINHLPGPELRLSADKTSIVPGESVQLQASGGVSYSWEPAEGLDLPTSATPLAFPTQTTTYTVTAWGENGCSTVSEITIEVDFRFIVEIPKLFIPANDQNWRVTNIESYPEVSLLIMDKFGKKVFAAAPYQNDWTAAQLKDGVYFYVFKDTSGKVLKSGSITLIN